MKACAGPTIVGVSYNQMTEMFEVFYRKELPKTHYAYTEAVDKLIQLNAEINPDWIYMDKGSGEVQYEMLSLYGKQHPESGLHKKVIANQLAEKTNIIDLYTGKATKAEIKPTMINNLVIMLESKKMIFNPRDKAFMKQLEDYRIVRISTTGVPVYTNENDHIVDALARAMFGFAKQYNALYKRSINSTVKSFNIYKHNSTSVRRTIDETLNNEVKSDAGAKANKIDVDSYYKRTGTDSVEIGIIGRSAGRPTSRQRGISKRRTF